MTLRLIATASLTIAAFSLSSCSNESDTIPLIGETRSNMGTGEALYARAKQADNARDYSGASKLYEKMADRYPAAPSADEARYRQAQILEQKGDTLGAFEAYDKFLSRYPASSLYSSALSRQANMAQSAADGDIKSSFLGLKSRLPLDKTVAMLEKVRDHAPRSRTASKAQFTIGRLNQSKHKTKESKNAIAAYRKLVTEQHDSPEAPEALFQTGMVLMDEAERGNQNQANLDTARESFRDYLTQYPNASRAGEARKYLSILSGQDVQRSWNIAEFYLKTGKTEAAKIYYRDVIKRTSTGSLHDQAQARLKQLGN